MIYAGHFLRLLSISFRGPSSSPIINVCHLAMMTNSSCRRTTRGASYPFRTAFLLIHVYHTRLREKLPTPKTEREIDVPTALSPSESPQIQVIIRLHYIKCTNFVNPKRARPPKRRERGSFGTSASLFTELKKRHL